MTDNSNKGMRELHARQSVLRVLDKHHINTGEHLTGEGWLKLALTKTWVKLHYTILAFWYCDKEPFRRRIKKIIDVCIPPHDGFANMSRLDKGSYYATFISDTSEELEITPKGTRFIGFGGYAQQLYDKYSGVRAIVVWVVSIILSPIIWEILKKLYENRAVFGFKN